MNSSSDIDYLTYDMIFREFKNKNPKIEIADYRPCCELFGFPNIDNAIVMWTKNGTKIVYKSEVEDEIENIDCSFRRFANLYQGY